MRLGKIIYGRLLDLLGSLCLGLSFLSLFGSGFLCFLSKAQPLMGAELRSNGRHLRGCQTDIAHFALKIAAGSQFENSTDRNPKIGAFSGEKSPDIRACFFHNVWFPLSKQCIIGNLNSSLVRTAIQTVYRNLTE